ncbi:MAG: phosphate acyltransferase PlsX [Phycisphaerae bacterium]
MTIRVAVDAMGGDFAPHAIVEGVVDTLAVRSDLEVMLVGDKTVIEREVDGYGSGAGSDAPAHDAGVAEEPRLADWRSRLQIIHASEVVGMDESPVDALRQKKDSSIAVLVGLASEGRADAIVSAGNTGAFAAACQLRMKPLACVARPGIAVTVPSFHGPFVLCDVGANIQAKPRHLHEYAVLASLYAERIIGIEKPRVALVSIGEESGKGTGLVKQTHALLAAEKTINYVGNAEGRELFENRCDVAICDGFVGNIILKFVEGLAEGLFRTIGREFEAEPEALRSRFVGALEKVWQQHDFRRYGGAPLLGINGAAIICHGRSNAYAIHNAIEAAVRFVSLNLNEEISNRLSAIAAPIRSTV